MNNLTLVFFYVFSCVAIAASLVVVTNKRPAQGVLSLALAMLALSGLFVLLQAYFIAVIQVLIYAGAILVLFLFVIMLLGIGENSETDGWTKTRSLPTRTKVRRLISFILPVVFFTELFIVMSALKNPVGPLSVAGTVEAIGEALFTDYLLPFELISGILLVGILGVVNLAQKELEQR